MLKLFYDHAYRIMTKDEYTYLRELGFEVFPEYTVAHEGTLSRFLYFKKDIPVPNTLPYHYLEFLEPIEGHELNGIEGLSFATGNISAFEEGIEGFKFTHKNYDWQNDEIDSSRRLGWNFVDRLSGDSKEFTCWITHYEGEKKMREDLGLHPNGCEKLKAIIFNSSTEFQKLKNDFKFNESSDICTLEEGIEITYADLGLDNVIGLIVLSCKSISEFKKFIGDKGREFKVGKWEGVRVILPNQGFHLLVC